MKRFAAKARGIAADGNSPSEMGSKPSTSKKRCSKGCTGDCKCKIDTAAPAKENEKIVARSDNSSPPEVFQNPRQSSSSSSSGGARNENSTKQGWQAGAAQAQTSGRTVSFTGIAIKNSNRTRVGTDGVNLSNTENFSMVDVKVDDGTENDVGVWQERK